MAAKLSISASTFSEPNLLEVVREASRGLNNEATTQARYLGSYLSQLTPRPKTMLIEKPYVDRHYLQEYVGYYATRLHAPEPHTTRVHFFASRFHDSEWLSIVKRSATEHEKVQQELSDAYLGFVVIRPIPSCPIGRTLLRYYGDVASRNYAAADTANEVHLAGLTLRFRGTPFQQQDQGLGACATTALWCALARVNRSDGGRTVTPLDVAHAANPSSGNSMVPSPEGLSIEQIQRAIRLSGYVPDVIRPTGDSFLLALKAYLRGGIPVILQYRVAQPSNELHAAAVIGYREGDDEYPAKDLEVAVRDFRLPSTGLTRLFVHDDRLGPYARLLFTSASDEEVADAKKDGHAPPLYVRFDPRRPGFEEFQQPHRVDSAIIPVYPKLRLTARGLLEYAADYWPALRFVAGAKLRDTIRFEPYITRGTDYLARLHETGMAPARVARIRCEAFLSRYVGVLRFSFGEQWALDVVLDGTDIKRNYLDAAPVLLVACADAGMAKAIKPVIDHGRALTLQARTRRWGMVRRARR